MNSQRDVDCKKELTERTATSPAQLYCSMMRNHFVLITVPLLSSLIILGSNNDFINSWRDDDAKWFLMICAAFYHVVTFAQRHTSTDTDETTALTTSGKDFNISSKSIIPMISDPFSNFSNHPIHTPIVALLL